TDGAAFGQSHDTLGQYVQLLAEILVKIERWHDHLTNHDATLICSDERCQNIFPELLGASLATWRDKAKWFHGAGNIVLKSNLLPYQMLAYREQHSYFLVILTSHNDGSDEITSHAHDLRQTTGVVLVRLVALRFKQGRRLKCFQAYDRQAQLRQLRLQPKAHRASFMSNFDDIS